MFQCAVRPGARLQSGFPGASHLKTDLAGASSWTDQGPTALRSIFTERYNSADSEWTFAEQDVRPYGVLLMNAEYFEELYGVKCGGGWKEESEEAPWSWVEDEATHVAKLKEAVEQQKRLSMARPSARTRRSSHRRSSRSSLSSARISGDSELSDDDSYDSDWEHEESAFTSLGQELLAGQLKFAKVYGQEEPPAAHKVDTPIQGHLLANARLSVASERGRI